MICDHQLKNIITLVPTKSFFFFLTLLIRIGFSIYIYLYTQDAPKLDPVKYQIGPQEGEVYAKSYPTLWR